MKKLISILLSVCLLLCACAPAFAAEAPAYDGDPVIIVPGYGASALFLRNADGSLGEQVWGWNIITDLLMDQLKSRAPEILSGAVLLTLGSAQMLGKALGEAAVDMLGVLAFNGDGESVNDITTIPNDPERSQWDKFEDYYDNDLYSEKEIGRTLDDYVPESQIFNFAVDFRYGALYNAQKLDEYIEQVKAYTGSDRVNLYAVSHGGQVTAAYLSEYGDKLDVNNAVLTVPAIGGSYVAYDLLSGNVAAQEEDLMVFIENALYLEQDFEWLLKTQPLEFVDALVKAMLPYVLQVCGNWESLWDFVPMDRFDELASAADESNAGLIAKTTAFHENTMANIGEALRSCRENGVNVSIVAGDGHPTVTGSQQNSDAIIGTAAATGALVAPWGQRFANGYVCTGDVCTNPAHNHLSPSMEIDASYGYLPDNTWFVEGMYHGMTFNEPYAEDLAIRLLTDELTDVYADPDFPQFRASENPAYAVYGAFGNSPAGYIDSDSATYTVKNISRDTSVKILSVDADGLDLSFDGDYSAVLAPGESTVFTVNGTIPQVSAARAAVTVTFRLMDSYTPLNFRTFRYTVDNGEPVAYDADAPYADVDFTPAVNALLPEGIAALLQKLGVVDLLRVLFTVMLALLRNLKNMI